MVNPINQIRDKMLKRARQAGVEQEVLYSFNENLERLDNDATIDLYERAAAEALYEWDC